MPLAGQSRRIDSLPATSGEPLSTDIVRPPRHVGKVPATEVASSPRIPRDALAGVAAGDVGEFALESGGKRETVQPFQFSGGSCERGFMRRRGAVDDEACARQHLEGGGDIAVGIEGATWTVRQQQAAQPRQQSHVVQA
jgi:hypothetical protein